MGKKEKQINVRLSEEQHSVIEEKAKSANFTSTSEYLRYAATNCYPNLCRSYLFFIETDGKDNYDLTIFLKDIRFEEDKITLTIFLDEKNTWKEFIYSGKNFTIGWLSCQGKTIDRFIIDRYKFRESNFFPLHFGHDVNDVALGMIILKS